MALGPLHVVVLGDAGVGARRFIGAAADRRVPSDLVIGIEPEFKSPSARRSDRIAFPQGGAVEIVFARPCDSDNVLIGYHTIRNGF